MKSAEDIVQTLKLIKFHLEKDNPGDAMEALNKFAAERVREDGCGNCGAIRSLEYDREKLHQDMKDLFLTCAKGDVDGHFDLNWFLDSIDDQIRLIAKSVERKARADALEQAAQYCENHTITCKSAAEAIRKLKDAK